MKQVIIICENEKQYEKVRNALDFECIRFFQKKVEPIRLDTYLKKKDIEKILSKKYFLKKFKCKSISYEYENALKLDAEKFFQKEGYSKKINEKPFLEEEKTI